MTESEENTGWLLVSASTFDFWDNELDSLAWDQLSDEELIKFEDSVDDYTNAD